jgi:hypothetical protein
MLANRPLRTGNYGLQRRIASIFCAAALLAACATVPGESELLIAEPPHAALVARGELRDERARFRMAFCDVLTTGSATDAPTDCAQVLWRLPDEAATPAARPAAEPAPAALRVMVVTGAFSDCFGADAIPFHDAHATLRSLRHRVETIRVGGRSGSAHNAAQIAAYLREHTRADERDLVLVGYSKGTTDVLEFLVAEPELASRVGAVISVAGSVGGSPLAQRAGSLYALLFAHLPYRSCPPGDAQVIESLRPELRREWLRRNPLPAHVRYYSVAAFTTRDRVARALLPSWEILFRDDRRNDGQLLPADALIPGSTLLGYVHADHWAAAIAIERELPWLAARTTSAPFPRAALISAILRVVAEDMSAPAPAGARDGT